MISNSIIVCLLAFSVAVYGYNLQSADNIEVKPRIHGGEDAKTGEFPHSVRILIFDSSQGKFRPYCSGSIIGERHVVTAKHCFNGTEPTDLQVIVGELLSDCSDDGQVEHRVSTFHYPPNNSNFLGDIGIMELETPIEFRPTNGSRGAIGAALLPEEDSLVVPGERGVVCGWGSTNILHDQAKKLQKINVTVAECRYSRVDSFCLSMPDENGGNLCKGDSGSGMVRKIKHELYVLLGVHSLKHRRKRTCGLEPELVMVSKHVPWIKQVMFAPQH